jgi:serine/threonine protein kinase
MAQKLNLANYEVLQTLGTGSFGRVRLSRDRQTGEYVALKILKKAEILRLKQVDHVISEFGILREINHPFLVNMVGYT